MSAHPELVKQTTVEQHFAGHTEKRKSKLGAWIRGLGITSAVIGFMSAVAGRIGEHAVGISDITNADYANAFNGGLIAMAAGAGIWGVGKLVEHNKQRSAK